MITLMLKNFHEEYRKGSEWINIRSSKANRNAHNDQSAAMRYTLRSASRMRRCARASLSARHSVSASLSEDSSANNPCRSYRFRALLHFRTTADRVECFRARRVNAASPEGRNTRRSRSAQERHRAPFSSVNVIHALLPRSSLHSSHLDSLELMNTFKPSRFDVARFTVVHFDYAKDEYQEKSPYLPSTNIHIETP